MDLDEGSESDFYGKCEDYKRTRGDSIFGFLFPMMLITWASARK